MRSECSIHISTLRGMSSACREAIKANEGIRTFADLFEARLRGDVAPIEIKPEHETLKMGLNWEREQAIRNGAAEAGMKVSNYVTAVFDGTLDRKHEA